MSDPLNNFAHDPELVARELRRLPFLEREALLLKARDGMTYAEIGAVLGIGAEQAEKRFASALVRLRARLSRARGPWWRFWRRA